MIVGGGEQVAGIKARIIRALHEHHWSDAQTRLWELWRLAPSLGTAQFIQTHYRELRPHVPLTKARVDMLRSFTVEPAVEILKAVGYLRGFNLDVRVGDFNAYAQELLDPQSQLYERQPDVVFLAVQTRAIAPQLWAEFGGLEADDAAAAVDRVVGEFSGWVRAFRAHSAAHLVIHTLETPVFANQGLYDAAAPVSQVEAITRVNGGLREIAGATEGVHLLNYDGLMARHGKLTWEDREKWLTARMPLAADSLVPLAEEWLRHLHPLCGKVAKVLVCDLDNTLWGGVVGEDGPRGIRLDDEYPGAAYRGLQRAILDLYRRGIMLAVCSKNNEADAREVLEHHAGMLLRPEHFAALRINWNDKVQNLREIAAELNVGTDALAFLDDNPREREWVRVQMPEVMVVELPDDPLDYEWALRREPAFERLSLTDEDRARGRMYAEQRQRRVSERSSETLEDFYRSLEMSLEMDEATPEMLERVAQLTQKTNQFNLTTRRYSVPQISEFTKAAEWSVHAARVRDRFGDNGIVGVIIVRYDGPVCEIDTLLLSCRVIGRTVETAMLAGLARQARQRGAQHLRGWFIPTAKNAPAQDFYARHGFRLTEDADGKTLWEFDLTRAAIECPPWIEVRQPMETLSA